MKSIFRLLACSLIVILPVSTLAQITPITSTTINYRNNYPPLTIAVYSEDPKIVDLSVKRTRKRLNEISSQWFGRYDRDHLWQQMNQALESGNAFILEQEYLKYLKKLKQISLKTNHYFNPARGKLLNTWRQTFVNQDNQSPPKTKVLNQLIQNHFTMQDVFLDWESVRSSHQQLSIDTIETYQSYLLDQIATELRELNRNKIVLKIDDNIKILGRENAPFKASETHLSLLEPLDSSVPLCPDEGLITQNRYQHSYQWKEKLYHSIIDFTTGRPQNKGLKSITVLHYDLTLAQAGAIAALRAGNNWKKPLKNLNLDFFIAIDQNNHYILSSNLQKRMDNMESCF